MDTHLALALTHTPRSAHAVVAYEDKSVSSMATVRRWTGTDWDTPCLGIGAAPVNGDLSLQLNSYGDAFMAYYAPNTASYKRYAAACVMGAPA